MIAKATQDLTTMHQSTNAIVAHLSNVTCVNWVSAGIIAGLALAFIAREVPPWVLVGLYGLAVGLIQGIARWLWNYALGEAEAMKPKSDS